jgi:hypothetical protein
MCGPITCLGSVDGALQRVALLAENQIHGFSGAGPSTPAKTSPVAASPFEATLYARLIGQHIDELYGWKRKTRAGRQAMGDKHRQAEGRSLDQRPILTQPIQLIDLR